MAATLKNLSFILYFMAAMPSSFDCGPSGSSRIKDQEVTTEVLVESAQTEEIDYMYYEGTVESGQIDDIDNLPLFPDVDMDNLTPDDDDYDYYDNPGYVKPQINGDTTFPAIRDVSSNLGIYP